MIFAFDRRLVLRLMNFTTTSLKARHRGTILRLNKDQGGTEISALQFHLLDAGASLWAIRSLGRPAAIITLRRSVTIAS
jgi:hypothetical protein